ncbi:MAG: hypothetical protein GY898_00435 [Proteobacteria bacterium]|nr:hypothetical protein [Pseudomonadota bacterium]
MARYDVYGAEMWTTNLDSGTAVPEYTVDSESPVLGDARFEYGDGRYVAYYTVRNGGGHYGDQMSYVDDDGNILSDGFDFGCAHSMAQDVAWHPVEDRFVPVCSSDDLPTPGILAWADAGRLLHDACGSGVGLVSTQLGQVVPTKGSSFLVAYNAEIDSSGNNNCFGHGLTVGEIDLDGYPTGVKAAVNPWANGTTQRDAVIARVGPDDGPEWYLTGFRNIHGNYKMFIIDRSVNVLYGPQIVNFGPNGAFWSRRGDDLLRHPDGLVSWVHIPGGSNQLFLFWFDIE